MDNKSYLSTNLQSDHHTSASLYDDCAGSRGTQFELSPVQATKSPRNSNSNLGEYSHLSHSGPSSQHLVQADYSSHSDLSSLQQLPKCDNSIGNDKELAYAANRLYDDPCEIVLNRQSDGAKLQQFATGKVSIAIIVLQTLILLLLVCVLLAVLLCTCTSDTSSNGNASWISGSILQHITGHQSIVNTSLLRIQDTSASTAAAVEDILRLLAVDKLLALEEDILVSCSNIKHLIPSSPSGYYHVNITQYIYCNMEELCGEEGGWTRLAYLNMSDITQNCPPGLEEWEAGGIRLCRIDEESKGCSEPVKFPTNGISYTHICGRVIGYQKGSTDALSNQNKSINGPYLDGVSITRGSPREHVWSYIAGQRSDHLSNANCPCNNGSTIQIQGFIGDHYYCESGSDSKVSNTSTLYSSDPLWDGKNCLALEAPCCKSPNLPWFHRDYGNATSTDYLELRVCRSGSRNNEDIPLQLYEIYIK